MSNVLSRRWRTPDAYVWACVVASITGWLPMLVLQPMMHGGTLIGEIVVFAGVVIGGYCTLEVIRSRTHLWAKVLWSIWLIPFAAAVIYGLVEATSYVPRLFLI